MIDPQSLARLILSLPESEQDRLFRKLAQPASLDELHRASRERRLDELQARLERARTPG